MPTEKQMERLQTAITEYLADYRKSDGGWAKITDGDINLLWGIINQLIELKCAEDSDGDRPIQVRVVNRRTHEGLHFVPMEYQHGPEDFEECLRTASCNLRIATGQMDTVINVHRLDVECPPKKPHPQ